MLPMRPERSVALAGYLAAAWPPVQEPQARAGDKHASALVIPSVLELDLSISVSYASSLCEPSASRRFCI